MSESTTLILLPQTAYDGGGTANIYTVTGESRPAAAYYLGNKDLQTVAIKLTQCTGNIVIEASLAATPTQSDWFKVYEYEANNDSPTSGNVSLYTNIEGNFVYMRAKIVDFSNGIVNYIKLSY